MRFFLFRNISPMSWLACLLVMLGTMDVDAQNPSQTNYWNNPTNPIPTIQPKPQKPKPADIQRAAKELRERIRKMKKDHRRGDIKQGDYKASYNLGVLFLFGAGAAKDEKSAFQHFLKSAEDAVYAPAMFNLAICYATGTGTRIDRVEAYKWWNLAAAQLYPEAAQARDNIAKYLNGEQIEAAQRMGRDYDKTLDFRIEMEKLWWDRNKNNRRDPTLGNAAYLLSRGNRK